MTTFSSAPDVTLLTDDGVRLFFVYDFDGVFNAEYRSGTFGKASLTDKNFVDRVD